MRTDSVRLNDDFIIEAQDMIKQAFGPEYVGKIKTKSNTNIQDAHEAIRPSILSYTPESLKGILTDDQYKIYDLIYRRTVMSLMADALYEEQSIEVENQGEVFEYGGSKLLFLGFHKGNPEYKEKLSTILDVEVGKTLEAKEITHEENQTKPKSRYTEASLIKDMEEFGIGRPSTYAETTRTLLSRKYVEKKQKALVPTEQGKLTIDELDKFFSNIINTNYTKKMETVLDDISNGEHESSVILDGFYHKFIALVKHADEHMEKRQPTQVGRDCPLCGAPLVIRKWRKGEFIGCSNFPRCKHTENLT
jgi:DNA topoisomerase-1